MMTPEQKQWIDSADYETLLRLWRFAPVGEPLLQGDAGQYYKEQLGVKRAAEPDGGVGASKRIGWD